jgi:MFS family permease
VNAHPARSTAQPTSITTDLPPRLDSLPWSQFHTRVVVALGITWLLDGLEVTVVGAVAPVLQRPDTLGLSGAQLGAAGSAYLGGAVVGALVFGALADRHGRKRLFLATLGLYLAATLLTAASFDFASFAACRALTGLAIGGEYAAINSAIDELLPARVRGRADLAINGTYWLGTALGAAATLWLLDPELVPVRWGWRAAFALGALLASAIALIRRYVPESPRWLLLHGREAEAERIVAEVEAASGVGPGLDLPTVRVTSAGAGRLRALADLLLVRYRRRTILCAALMVAQAFFYNAIFFTYSLTLTRFYAVRAEDVGLHLLPFALANFAGPLLLGWLFDRAGRRIAIATSYALSGLGLYAVAWAFHAELLSAFTQTLGLAGVFFVASAAASSAYLSASELFPVAFRALAIAVFYALGTLVGGFSAPLLFGAWIGAGSRTGVFYGYAFGAALMVGAALVALRYGVAAEGKSLEELNAD